MVHQVITSHYNVDDVRSCFIYKSVICTSQVQHNLTHMGISGLNVERLHSAYTAKFEQESQIR